MYKKLMFAMVLLFCIIASNYGTFKRNDAEGLLLTNIISDRIGTVDLYLSNDLIVAGCNVAGMGHTILTPYEKNWVAFIDEAPALGWTHACTYVFIDGETGQYQLHQDEFPFDGAMEFSKISAMSYISNTTIVLPPGEQTNNRPIDNNLYAILINATQPGSNSNYLRFWNELSAMYTTLVYNYGCPKSNIRVLSTDATHGNNFGFIHESISYRGLDLDFDRDSNTNSCDIQYGCNLSSLSTVFAEIGGQVGPNDKVVVFLTGHGAYENSTPSQQGGSNFVTWVGEIVLANTFNSLLNNLNHCDQVTVIATGCQSGGYINGDSPITGNNRTVITSVNYSNSSSLEEREPAELWYTPVNNDVTSSYGEFAYYFISALRGKYPVRANIGLDNPLMINQPWADGPQVGSYLFPGFPAAPNPHPADLPRGYLTENGYNGNPLLFRAFQYADIWDTVSDQELVQDGNYLLYQTPNYCNVYTTGNLIPSWYRTHPQYNSNGCLFRDRQTLSSMNYNLNGYIIRDAVKLYNRDISITGYLRIFGSLHLDSGSEIVVQNAGSVRITGLLSLNNDSEIRILSNGIVQFDGGKLSTNGSLVNVFGELTLADSGLLEISNNSRLFLYSGAFLKGTTNERWCDPNTGMRYNTYEEAQIHYPEISDDHVVPGDRLIVDNSLLRINAGASVTGVNDARWDGITIRSSRNTIDRSYVMGEIRNVKELKVDNSLLELTQSDIHNCGQLKVINGSDVTMYESDYHDNDCGIYCERSRINLWFSDIYNNSSTGLSINYPSSSMSFMTGTKIFNNLGNGVELRNSLLNINPTPEGSRIYNNNRYGYFNLSSAPSSIYGGSQIYNNGSTEILTMYDCFPVFSNPTSIALPNVRDDNGYNPSTFDKYLLAAVGLPQNQTVNVASLAIDTSDNIRFYPSFSSFVFGEPQISAAELLFTCALDSIYSQAYASAYEIMKHIGNEYPDTPTAIKAIPYLPYLCKAIAGDPNNLFEYLSDITEISLKDVKLEAISLLKLSHDQFAEAISYLDQILQDPPSEEKELLAELDQAYCYYKLVTSGSKNIPSQSKYKPRSLNEYMQIRNSILNFLTKDDSMIEETASSNRAFTIHNYPNPFNPSTTISFSIPFDMPCRLDIFNVRGQKVKTVLNETRRAGSHSIIWNGTDENGSSVSSGVYYYKLSTPDQSHVSKMLLMK